MKKILKIFTVIFALILLSCVAVISVTASGDDTQSASANEYTVTWDATDVLGKSVKTTEEGTEPTPPSSLMIAQTDAYKYVFEETGDNTYTLKGYAGFAIKANLNLSDKFTFNIYIPRDIYDNSINGLFLNGVSTGKISEIKNIEGADYYCVSHPVFANKASVDFSFDINIKGYNGHEIKQTYTFSVSRYIDKVLAGKYGDKAIALAEATKNYISALDCFNGTSSDIGNISYTPSKSGSMTPVNTYVKNARLLFKESIVFRFYSDSQPEITFTTPYSENGTIATKNEPLTAADWKAVENSAELTSGNYYYDVILPVKFLNQGITVTVDGNSGTLYLDDYIRYAQENFDNSTKNLVNSIGNYSNAALAYANVNSGEQTPTVVFKVNEESIDKIVYDSNSLTAAQELKAFIEAKTNSTVSLIAVDDSGAVNNAIILSLVDPVANYDSRVEVDGNNLRINVGLKSFIAESVDLFANDYIKYTDTDISFTENFSKDYFTNSLYYSDFGAVGDGVTEDFFNLKAAHDHANETKRHTVYADSGKTYYIHETRRDATGNTPETISIKTNVNWGDAKFIIDDSDICTWDGTGRTGSHIFYIMPDTAMRAADENVRAAVLSAGLNRETKKIDLGLGEKVMIIPYNSNHKVYRRLGYGAAAGQTMHEVIVIDENGNVDPETPVMFDYTNLTAMDIYPLSDDPITIEGGKFTTKASNIDVKYLEDEEYKYRTSYIHRGISIQRSYTTMKNVKHYVTGEITLSEQYPVAIGGGKVGPPYQGFFSASAANHVTLDGCVLSGRRCYPVPGSGTMGTYGYTGSEVNKFVFKDCVQQNFWITIDENYNITAANEDTPDAHVSMEKSTKTGWQMYWGLGNTNFCKNFEFIDSTLSRFDAHEGLYNGKIINSTVNTISIVGGGNMIIENSRKFMSGDDSNLVSLRSDYGSTWDGKITIDGMKAFLQGKTTYIVSNTYKNFYYGYQTCFPSIEINDLDYYNMKTRAPLSAGFEVYLCDETPITEERAIHLNEITGENEDYAPYYRNVDKLVENGRSPIDSNDDGVIDDKDKGDGYVDGTNVIYDPSNTNSHIKAPGIFVNYNPKKPPEIIRIIGNDGVDTNGDGKGDGGYVFIIPNTYGYGISDGGYYDSVENYGGFFGDTQFKTETNTYLGTYHKNTENGTFRFNFADGIEPPEDQPDESPTKQEDTPMIWFESTGDMQQPETDYIETNPKDMPIVAIN